ncbi:acyl carrier protein [Agilicoccus flavus]|uniref:acyl carrier protein n=1 Tax=Agilicoccus flavus TaxID=2775968 RepID=UPI001CF690EE|nr:acyl carrier protein [Agilicoccus flavus]
MTSETTTIREVLAAHGRLSADAHDIAEDADLYALGLASHATVNVVMALEDELDIEIPDELLVKSTFASIGDIRRALATVDS